MGLSHYFKIELTNAKILALAALLTPRVPFKIKEFAYFGLGIALLSASIAHLARGNARLSLLFGYSLWTLPPDPRLAWETWSATRARTKKDAARDQRRVDSRTVR